MLFNHFLCILRQFCDRTLNFIQLTFPWQRVRTYSRDTLVSRDTMWMRAEHLLARHATDPSLVFRQDYMPVPGPNGTLVPLTTSWAWAITATHPARQAAAADLIQFLATPAQDTTARHDFGI